MQCHTSRRDVHVLKSSPTRSHASQPLHLDRHRYRSAPENTTVTTVSSEHTGIKNTHTILTRARFYGESSSKLFQDLIPSLQPPQKNLKPPPVSAFIALAQPSKSFIVCRDLIQMDRTIKPETRDNTNHPTIQ
ncbi:hypothetical protein F2Q70_00018476 [Brassica cretica]|uniref:Uncharacterized protein n=1 Tax=Brassica cretica TaxID=69181 RepID=A0A8S9HZA2_BRACR|nr:hypothetical protein F2Q70_00018476 [Brassica cretica]